MHSDPDDPVTVDRLADLQAGLLDDRTAARLRQRARTEPDIANQLAALDRIRRDLGALGADSASAPPVPAAVTARIGTALRSAPPTEAPPSSHLLRRVAAIAGLGAIVAAAAVGTATLLEARSDGQDAAGAPTVADADLPLSADQLDALLLHPPELGDLADPRRLGACLGALGYPASTSPLGARRWDVRGRPGVLLLLPGDGPRQITAIVVTPRCNSVDTGLITSTVVGRP